MPDLPIGTVTLQFADVESGTRLWEMHPQAMRAAVARSSARLQQAVDTFDGVVFRSVGDGLCGTGEDG